MPEPKTLAPQANETSVTEVTAPVTPTVQTDVNVNGEVAPTQGDIPVKDPTGLDLSKLGEELGETFEVPTKKEEPPKAETTKVVPDKVDPAVIKQAKVARDYNGIDEADVPLFKQMGNEAFAKMRDLYVKSKESQKAIQERDTQIAQLKTGKATLPDSYYEHPEAFVLSPDYQPLVRDTQLAINIERHWQDQLAKVEENEDWQDISVDKDGNVVLSEPQAATSKVKAAIISRLQAVNNYRTGKENELRSFVTNYKQRVDGVKKFVENDVVGKIFGNAYSDESLNKPENAEVREFYNNAIKAVPVELQSNVLTKPFVMALTTIATLVKNQRAMSEAAKVATSKKEDATKVQPTAAGMSTGAKIEGKKLSIEEFEKALEE